MTMTEKRFLMIIGLCVFVLTVWNGATSWAGQESKQYHYQQIINIEDDWFDQTPGLGSIQHGYYWKLQQLTKEAAVFAYDDEQPFDYVLVVDRSTLPQHKLKHGTPIIHLTKRLGYLGERDVSSLFGFPLKARMYRALP